MVVMDVSLVWQCGHPHGSMIWSARRSR